MPAPINNVGGLTAPLAGIISKNINLGNKFAMDMAQSRFFTVEIEGFSQYDINLGGLPVKSISYTITGIETMPLSIGVFRDIPIPIGKKLPKLSLTLADDNIDQLETQFRVWYDSMFPKASTGTVAYLNEMVRRLQYTSYNTSGVLNFSYSANVILTDDISISRDYESNGLKEFEISLIILNDQITVNNSNF